MGEMGGRLREFCGQSTPKVGVNGHKLTFLCISGAKCADIDVSLHFW